MNSGYPSAEQVLDDLGDKVALGLALVVARTRADRSGARSGRR